MGQRANLVILQNGAARLFYDHWCAIRLDAELFWGPQYATWFIEQREAGTDADWLDEVWCEGGAVVDMDRQVLVFFGGEDILDDVPRRRAFLTLMGQNWPGWEIRWAHEGVVSLGGYLDIAAERFLHDHRPNVEQRFCVLTDFPEDNQTLLTVTKDGATTARRVFGDSESLELGPDGLGVLNETAGVVALDWPGEMPTAGIHLDFDTKALAFWWGHPTAVAEHRARAAWPGWAVRWLHDRYEEHLALVDIDIRLPVVAPADMQKSILDDLRLRHHGEAHNLARELAAGMGDAQINPATDEARGSVGDPAWKIDLLDALAGRLPIVEN